MDNLQYDLPVMHSHVAVRLANFIIAFGGEKQNKEPLSHHVIWMYNIYTEQWSKHVIPDTKVAPPRTSCSCAVAVGSDIYMFGGWRHDEGNATNTLWKLTITSTESFVWTKVIAKCQEKTPSPRCHHSGWESTGKLWTFGGTGTSPDGYLNELGDFNGSGINNQLLCFNVSKQEWKDVKSSGTKPEPRWCHATTIINHNVWLYGGFVRLRAHNDLYQLNLHSLVWSKIQTDQITPQKRSSCSLNTITNSQLLLHGSNQPSTWIFDVPTLTWKQQTIDNDHPRFGHTGTECMHGGVIIIGGKHADTTAPYRLICVKRNAKSLQQLAMKTIYEHRGILPWRALPKRLITQIMFPAISEDLA